MPSNFIKCVNAIIKEGEGKAKTEEEKKALKSKAYAICTVQYQKSHNGENPQEASAEVMGKFYEMVKSVQERNRMPMSVSEMKKMMVKYLKERETQRKKMMK